MMMREALRPNSARRRVVGTPRPIPAPTKGWYALENDTDLPRGSAKTLRNWWPQPDTVSLRKGIKAFATGLPGPALTVMAYRSADDPKLFAAAGDGIFDVTAGRAVGARSRAVAEPRLSFINMATSAGQYLIVANGADEVMKFNGAAWSDVNFIIDPVTAGSVQSTDLSFVFHYRSRLFFLAQNSTRFYYLPADSIGGTLGVFEVGGSLKLGGKLIAGGVWSIDGGAGPDDLMAVISDQGEVVIYRGTNPGDPTSWERVGVYTIGKPVGDRCVEDLGGELIVVCEDGAVALSTVVRFDRSQQRKAAVTSNIAKAINMAIRERGRGREWMIQKWPAGSMLICNLPAVPQGGEQYVMNTQNGAWAHFSGIDAICWEEFNDDMYFGTPDGRVMLFWHGATDDGEAIEALMVPAFSTLGFGGLKSASLMRSNLVSSDVLTVKIGVGVDYEVSETDLATLDFDAPTSNWDAVDWDVADWADDDVIRRQAWQGISGVGYAFAPILSVVTPNLGADYNIDCRVISFDIVAANGGVL